MYRPDKIMKSGSYVDPDFTGADLFQTSKQTAVLDMTQPSPTWRDTAPMAFGRGYHALTVLPDGKVLVTGGEQASDGRDLTKSALAAEMWDPATETWTTMASQHQRAPVPLDRRCCCPTAACSSRAAARRPADGRPIS